MRFSLKKLGLAAALTASAFALGHLAFAGGDPGQDVENLIQSHSNQYFGVEQPLEASSTTNITQAQALADPTKLAALAKGLKAKAVVISDTSPNIDQIAFWPNATNPEWLIYCNEQGSGQVGLERAELSDGHAEVIVAGGLSSCDPVRLTPWGTIIFCEESGASGRLFELIDPLDTTGVTINGAGVASGGTNPSNVIMRGALGNLSFEGLAVYPNGVTYFADELRPGTSVAGGSYYKFIPTTLRSGNAPITNLSQSPLAAGNVYGLRLGLRSTNDSGQGTQTGLGQWLDTSASGFPNLGAAGVALKLTGFYRPEDAEIDAAAFAAGEVRWCINNTGNESPGQPAAVTNGHTYGETVCLTDGTFAEAAANNAKPEVQFLVIGNPQLSMMDNIAQQPGTGNFVIVEDGEERTGHNDMWACMDDGQDNDLLSDGCIRIASLNDGTGNPGGDAEWTGPIFSGDGKHIFVSVQHNVSGKGVILDITGWK